MKKFFVTMVVLMASAMSVNAQILDPEQIPESLPMEFALQLKVTLGDAYTCGETQHGRRTIIPITGGTFEGPNIKGTIINGGADYQIANTAINRTELEAIYCIKTDDGVNIHVRNRVLSAAIRMLMVTPLSTSVQLLSLRPLQTANTLG